MSSPTFTLLNKTKGNPELSGLPFVDIKEAVLGKDYELSLVLLSEKEMHEINLKSRSKDKPTHVLSFPLSETDGEIFICPDYSRHEAPLFEREFANYILFLFIHGLLHLKGYDHGSTMEHEEVKIRKQFGV
jgi:probable rRNA maturation factor